jgi:hypothetical protein
MKTRKEIVDLITKTEKDIRSLDRVFKYNRIDLKGDSPNSYPFSVNLEEFEKTIIYNALKENYLETLKTLTKELDEHLNKKRD